VNKFADKNQVTMKVLDYETAKNIIVNNHYSGCMPPFQLALGFYIKEKINCVIVFGPSATPNMVKSLPSPKYWELTRLFSFDWGGKNIESICISKALKYIEQNYDKNVIISFADPSEGHAGYIYQATNWLYCGQSQSDKWYFVDGKKIHPRSMVAKYGTRSEKLLKDKGIVFECRKLAGKHRYVYFLGSKGNKRKLRKKLKYDVLPYPKLSTSEAGEVSKATRIASSNEGLVRFQKPASGVLTGRMQKVKQILQSINWPDEVLVIDFETYFDQDYTLKDLSTAEYIADERFEFTGLGLQIDDHTPRFVNGDRVEATIKRLKSRFGKALHNCTVVAKNNKFDILILAEKFGIYPPYTIDIEDLSRYYDSRMSQKLKDLAKLLKLQPKGDTMQFKGLHWEDMSPDQRSAMREYCLGDIKDEVELLKILLPMLDNPGTELDLARHTLNLYLKPTFILDIDQSRQIAGGMGKALSKDLSKVAWVLKYRSKAKPTIPKILRAKKIFSKILQKELDRVGDGEKVPMKEGKNGLIPATAKNDVGFQLLLVHKDERVRNLCNAKMACTGWPLHQKKVDRMIREANCTDGKLRIPLCYYGCHTGRWSARSSGWNPLNLGGKGRGRPLHPLIGQVRNTLMAPDGYVLLINDSAQIEARELAWVAHQDDLVEDFRNHADPYSKFATKLFQAKVWKVSEEEAKTPEGKTATIRRGFGKDAILGCGYGMGSITFYDRCRSNDNLRPLFDSGEYDFDFISKLIQTYRTTYDKIPAFWREIERCFRVTAKYGKTMEYRISDKASLRFEKFDSDLYLWLPSGRKLVYRKAKVRAKDDSISDIHGVMWGGHLTENVIQAICRCLMVHWLMECEKAGIPIVLHTYDELVGCVPEEQAEEKLKVMDEIMVTAPAWAEGLPLETEGYISKRYKK
jgi:DNA polymerase